MKRRNDVSRKYCTELLHAMRGAALMPLGLQREVPVDFIRSHWWNVQDHMFGYMKLV